MSSQITDSLSLILEQHRVKAAAAHAEAEQRARDDVQAQHECGPRVREFATPILREWSKRLSVEGYPTTIDDRLGCRPPVLILRLAPRGGPESSLCLGCLCGGTVRFRITIAGKEIGGDVETPLTELRTAALVVALGRFVPEALEATLAHR